MGFVSLIEWECNYKSYRLVQLPVLSVLCLHLIAVGIAALVRLRGQKIINFGEGRPAIEIVRVDLELLRTVPGFSAAPLTAIWNVLSKLEPYSAKGYLEDKLTEHSVVISKSQRLELLRKRGYIFKDEVSADSG